MANALLTPSIIAQETLMQLENDDGNLTQKVFRGYEKEWTQKSNGWKVGDTVTAKAPIQFRVQDGETINIVDLREEDVSMTVNYRKHIAWKFTGTEMTLKVEEFSDRFIKPAMTAFKDYIASTILGLYKYVPNQVGVPGSLPSSLYTIGEASAVLTDHSVPKDGNRHLYLDPWASIKIADQMKGLINNRAETAIAKGAFNNVLGFNVYESQNVATHICGTGAGLTTNLVDGASSEGDATITIDQNGSWSNTLTAGDIFKIASVYGVNPINGNSTGRLRQFCVNTAVPATGTEQAIDCTPGAAPWNIYSASAAKTYLPYQTVDALPANNAAITVDGSASLSHKVNMAFHKNAIALFMVPVQPPEGLRSETKSANGFTITVCYGGDIWNYTSIIRLDILFGVKLTNPFMACRIAGQ